ncbi:MAG: carboxypeptidase regulatory-like domain-containing protein [Armatimonadota bacterium]|nr:carboxypeptidase regulatory-like domain-containing protein [Armatimonadota bacterium]
MSFLQENRRVIRTTILATVLLLGAFILTGCGGGGGGGGGGTGTVIGRAVENSADSTPIENARITVSGSSNFTFTNALGQFSLTAPAGTRTITASATGFANKSVMTDVTANMTTNVGDLRMDDQPPPPPGP